MKLKRKFCLAYVLQYWYSGLLCELTVNKPGFLIPLKEVNSGNRCSAVT